MKVSKFMIGKCKNRDKLKQFDWKVWSEIFKKEYADIDAKFIDKKEVLDIIDETYRNLDMGKTIPIFIQRLKEKLK